VSGARSFSRGAPFLRFRKRDAVRPIADRDRVERESKRARASGIPDGWRVETKIRINELNALTALMKDRVGVPEGESAFWTDIDRQLETAKKAANHVDDRPRWRRMLWPIDALSVDATLGGIDAAEASLLRMGTDDYVIGHFPSVKAKINRYLPKADPRRIRVHQIVRASKKPGFRLAESERTAVVTAYHAAASQRRRDLRRAGSFFGVLVATTVALSVVAVAVFVLGLASPQSLPLCFQPESDGQYAIVCPTDVTRATKDGAPAANRTGDLDNGIGATVNRGDVALIEVVGVLAAALAAAMFLRGLRGTSTPYRIPLALALLKLPAGALTAIAGLLLMQGGFVPGLSALDTSGQIVAWALIFGYSQQLVTGLIDRQAHGVLRDVGGRGADGARQTPTT
jgi:hypothetical protein